MPGVTKFPIAMGRSQTERALETSFRPRYDNEQPTYVKLLPLP